MRREWFSGASSRAGWRMKFSIVLPPIEDGEQLGYFAFGDESSPTKVKVFKEAMEAREKTGS